MWLERKERKERKVVKQLRVDVKDWGTTIETIFVIEEVIINNHNK